MSKALKLAVVAGIIVSAAGAAYVYASPFLTANDIRDAAYAHNASELAEHIDFPAVKERMKGSMNAKMAKDFAASELKDNPFGAAGLALAGAALNQMIDSLVTPEGLAVMLSGDRQGDAAPSDGASKPTEWSPNVSLGYENRDRFVITMDKEGEKTSFVMKREGLATWKVVEIRLPIESAPSAF